MVLFTHFHFSGSKLPSFKNLIRQSTLLVFISIRIISLAHSRSCSIYSAHPVKFKLRMFMNFLQLNDSILDMITFMKIQIDARPRYHF
jgi:hypothetical protein